MGGNRWFGWVGLLVLGRGGQGGVDGMGLVGRSSVGGGIGGSLW